MREEKNKTFWVGKCGRLLFRVVYYFSCFLHLFKNTSESIDLIELNFEN